MDDRRVGRAFREIRIHLGLRQADVSVESGVSQRTISEIELGRLEHVRLRTLRKVADALDVRVGIDTWWRSGRIDHLLDQGHAALVEHVARTLRAEGWTVRVEVTFNEFGERGSADLVAWHPAERALLIIEVKTRIDDTQEATSTFSKKVRILPQVLARDEGWDAMTIGRVLVLADTRLNRALVRDHAATFDSIWPARTSDVRRWVQRPRRPGQEPVDARPSAAARASFGGIWFIAAAAVGTNLRAVSRVRRPTTAASTGRADTPAA
ncbi:MAG: helix-turn-helix domain-containing protein [Candidatus Limnocylindrales bacterium]